MTIELIQLGNQCACAANIIVNRMLKNSNKGLFQFGHYHFNDIIDFLNDNNYCEIYNKEHLELDTQTGYTYHKKYKFTLNHDYTYVNRDLH